MPKRGDRLLASGASSVRGAITPRMTSLSSEQTKLRQLLDRAIGAHQRGQLGEAERLYLDILKAEPRHFDAQHLLGVIRHQQGRSVEALALIGAALQARPDSAQALANQGAVLCELRRYEEALASFDRALALRPNHAETLFNRGDTLHELKRYTDAIASYEQAIALRPDHPYAYSGLAESALAICDWARTEKLRER